MITRLNRIRHENPALQNTWNVHFADVENDQIICYGKVDEASRNVMIMAVNMDPYHTQGSYLRLPLAELGLAWDRPFHLHDLLSDSHYTWQGEWNYVELNPHLMPGHVFLRDAAVT